MNQSSRNQETLQSPQASRRAAFTLIEILVVVAILGILASIVVPQMAGATQTSRESMLKDELRFLRSQIALFKSQHRDTPPGYPGGDRTASPTEVDFVTQLTIYTNENCDTNSSQSGLFRFGPYLSVIPENPLNRSATVLVTPTGAPLPAPAVDGHGWIYRPETQEIIANSVGTDPSGTPYSLY